MYFSKNLKILFFGASKSKKNCQKKKYSSKDERKIDLKTATLRYFAPVLNVKNLCCPAETDHVLSRLSHQCTRPPTSWCCSTTVFCVKGWDVPFLWWAEHRVLGTVHKVNKVVCTLLPITLIFCWLGWHKKCLLKCTALESSRLWRHRTRTLCPRLVRTPPARCCYPGQFIRWVEGGRKPHALTLGLQLTIFCCRRLI